MTLFRFTNSGIVANTAAGSVAGVAVVVISVLCITLLYCVSVVEALQISLVSDVHYDPFYGTAQALTCTRASSPTFGAANCDSPMSLLTSLMNDAQEQNSSQTLYAGDWQRHGYTSDLPCDRVFDTLSEILVNTTTSKARTTSITYGNSDMSDDYYFDWKLSKQPLLECHVKAMQKHGLLSSTNDDGTNNNNNSNNNNENAELMSKYGYYTHDVGQLRIISLHTLLWTYKLKPSTSDDDHDPANQLAFLREKLTNAREQGIPVIILGHIPPTLDVYNVVHHGSFSSEDVDMYWKPTYQTAYFNLIAEFKDIVKMQVFGHTHTFALVALPFTGNPLVVVGGVTPIYNTSPNYLVATLTENATLELLRRRYFGNDNKWHDGYDVTGALGLKRGLSDMIDVQKSIRAMMHNDETWHNYRELIGLVEDNEYLKVADTCNTFCRAVTVCAMINDTYAGIQECVTELTTPSTDTEDPNVKGSVITILLILGLVFAVVAILLLRNIIPKIRAGDFSFSKIDFDFRSQLFNLPPRDKRASANLNNANQNNINMDVDERTAKSSIYEHRSNRNDVIV